MVDYRVAVLLSVTLLTAGVGAGQTPQPVPATPPAAPGQMSDAERLRAMPDLPGNGPYPSSYEAIPQGGGLVVYRPDDLEAAARSRKLGIYLWGNGGCQGDAASARFHLLDMASHGFVVVVPGRIGSGPRGPRTEGERPRPVTQGPVAPQPGAALAVTPARMTGSLDWILAENTRPGSEYFGKLDPERVAVSGHSCGGLLSITTSFDPRVHAVIAEDSGVLPDDKNVLPFVTKGDLTRLRLPILYIVGGPTDVAEPNALDDFNRIKQVPVFVADRPGTGHGGSFGKPGSEGTEIELAWLAWQLDHDQQAAKMFEGPDCGLCRRPEWQVHRSGIK